MNNTKIFKRLRNRSKCLSLVAVLSVTYFSANSYAQYLTGPVASSLGGAGRAAVDDGEQVVLNPALAVHGSPFTSEIFYVDGYADKNEHDNIKGFGLTDNTEDLIASGGFYFAKRRRTFAQTQTVDENYYQLAMGGFVVPHLSAGVTFTLLDSDLLGGQAFRQWDANLGLSYNPDPKYAFGLVIYNLASRDPKIPLPVQNQDSIFLASHMIFADRFRVRIDLGEQLTNNPEQKLHLEAGLESKVGDFIVTRVGFDNDGLAKRSVWSLGLGFDGPRIKLDYFYRRNTDSSAGAMHGVDMRLPFW